MRNYEAAIWRGYGNERPRWAVFCKATHVFYFPDRYGRKAAEKLARQMEERQ